MHRVQDTNKQSVSMNGLCVSLLCVLSFRVEVTEEKDTKIVPCKWHSEEDSNKVTVQL